MEIFSPGKLPNLVTVDNIRETRFSRNPQIARVLTEFGLVRELNEGVKRIYADMKEQHLASPIYTETEQSVTLILKNNIDERTKIFDQAAKGTDQGTDQADQGTDQANQGADQISIEKRIISAIQKEPQITQKQLSQRLQLKSSTVKYYMGKLEKMQRIKREGTNQKGKWIVISNGIPFKQTR